jgi:type I restriction enzyme R subunit
MNEYTEDALVEKPAIELFKKLGWTARNCYYETFGPHGDLGRETSNEVVLVQRLRPALEKLNPGIGQEAIRLAIEELTRDRSTLSSANANREIYKLLKDGVKVQVRRDDGEEIIETVRVIDWENPENNDFFLASQFWISGEMYKRRADLVGFVNGLPLLFVELKASHKRLEHAYERNLRDYKDTIPHAFWHNAFIILSNGSKSRVGTMTAEWEHFAEWKKINDEGEEGVVSLETMIRGMCDKRKMLDLVENFTLFDESRGELVKMVAKNHQYLGVNRAIKAVQEIRANQGRLGVFWHTQGSGKSYSMVFFSQKIHRKLAGNWTFLIVTDRQELDGQIYKNFAGVGAVTEPEERARAQSGEHLKELLREDHRYLFTLIQKFRTEDGKEYPKLSDRSDIIVITDEAHRSQYDIFALNMHNALPKAAFIGFTGTPLIVGEEKTRQVFGDYVSIYNFRQSVEDQNTVPLFYENRIPEVQLTNEDLNEDMEKLLEEAELDEGQERKLEREFGREYQLITRDDRLEKIAEDIVEHFAGRGYKGKAMVVSIDKATAVRMYDKVQKYWRQHLAELRGKLAAAQDGERKELEDAITFMETTDMAVVVSQSQNEVEEFKKKGLDIATHRRRMVNEQMDEKFKDPKTPFRLVFVCAMWMTGFDAPSCSTIYLDKPMKNHTLMQTIARANRVFKEKPDGIIVDYVGVFRSLQKALAIYGSGSGGGVEPGDMPVARKSVLLGLLKKAIEEATQFCAGLGIDPAKIQAAAGFDRVRLIDDAVDAILVNDETRRKYVSLASNVEKLFRAILPDFAANEFGPARKLFAVLAHKIQSLAEPVDIDEVVEQMEELLDSSIAAEGYVIRGEGDHRVDLSKVDFEALKARFARGHKHIEAEKLKSEITRKLRQMVRANRTRMDYLKKFQEMIDEYNAGSYNIDELFKKLTTFAQALNEEEKRAISERLSEEELAIFDLLTKPDLKLTKGEEAQVKKVARELLEKLKREKFVLDWRRRQQTRAAVLVAIETELDALPERPYPRPVYAAKCQAVYQHVYDSYYGENRSVYVMAAGAMASGLDRKLGACQN